MNNDLSLISNDGLQSLLHTFQHDIVERGGLLLLRTQQIMEWDLESVPVEDPVDVESTMSKRYVSELAGELIDGSSREQLMVCGRAIVQVWAERIAARFPGRNVLFYLGGEEDVIVRFHVRRPGIYDWLDLEDRPFILRSRLEVYELHDQRLERLR